MKRLIIALAVMALVTSDVTAGPILNRLRERRAAHGTCSTGCSAAPSSAAKPVQVATVSGIRTAGYTLTSGGCANGSCATPAAGRFVIPVK